MSDTVLVTGATGGLGGAVVEVLEGAGWTVATLGIEDVDLTDAADAERAVGEVSGLAAVVNLVGGFDSGAKVHEVDPARFARMFELNVTTAFNVARASVPVLLERGGGPFVAVSAQAAERPFPGAAGYISAKAAVLAFVRALDAEYRAEGLRANVIQPSMIDTPANREAMPNSDRKGWTSPAAIGEVIRFLISSEALAVRGAALPV